MQVRKFEAASLDEALHLVKTELGPHALILSTKNRKPRWFNRGVIEVTAAYEPTKEPPPSLDQVFDEQSLVNIFPHRRKKDSDQPNERTDARAARSGRYVDIHGARPRKTESTRIEDRFRGLGISAEISKDLANQLIFEYPQKDLKIGPLLEKSMARVLAGRVKCMPVDSLMGASTWVPIGISGSGKTSVMVKLALVARARTRDVALVGLDRARLMARDALKHYARLIHVPFYCEKNFGRAKESLQLVDCPSLPIGGSDEDWDVFEKTVKGKRSFLVVDSTMRLKEAERFLEQVQRFAPAGVVLTKIDLVTELGPMFELLRASRLPLVGVSMAQTFKVPMRFLDEREFGLLVVKHGVFE